MARRADPDAPARVRIPRPWCALGLVEVFAVQFGENITSFRRSHPRYDVGSPEGVCRDIESVAVLSQVGATAVNYERRSLHHPFTVAPKAARLPKFDGV